MTQKEIVALVNYMEFNMSKMIEQVEPHMTDQGVIELYAQCAHILDDLTRTLFTQYEIGNNLKSKR